LLRLISKGQSRCTRRLSLRDSTSTFEIDFSLENPVPLGSGALGSLTAAGSLPKGALRSGESSSATRSSLWAESGTGPRGNH